MTDQKDLIEKKVMMKKEETDEAGESGESGESGAPAPPSYEDSITPGTSTSISVAHGPSSSGSKSAGTSISGGASTSGAASTSARETASDAAFVSAPESDAPREPPEVAACDGAPDSRPPYKPPHDAQRAIAPFTWHQKNQCFSGTYAVSIGDSKRGPDIDVRNTNGVINAAFYLVGRVPRPAGVVAGTSNGKVVISVAREPGQVLDIKAESTNGRVRIRLPRDYVGMIALRTNNGSAKLSSGLAAGSVIVPGDGDSKTTTYRVGKPAGDPEDPHAYPDRCAAKAQNGSIVVSYVDEEVDECSGGCVVM